MRIVQFFFKSMATNPAIPNVVLDLHLTSLQAAFPGDRNKYINFTHYWAGLRAWLIYMLLVGIQ